MDKNEPKFLKSGLIKSYSVVGIFCQKYRSVTKVICVIGIEKIKIWKSDRWVDYDLNLVLYS